MPRTKGLLVGGLGYGLVAALLGHIPYLDFACCLWTFVGGLLATSVHVKASDTYLTKGDGAITGLLNGLVMYVLWLVTYPVAIVAKGAAKSGDLEWALESLVMGFTEPALLMAMLGTALVALLFYVGFSAVGGIVGVQAFESRTPSEFDV